MTDRLGPGESLNAQFGRTTLMSQNRCYALVLQNDGNLVIYIVGTPNALWASDTVNDNPSFKPVFANMQNDGNFVLETQYMAPVWSTNTAGNPGSTIIMQNDGNLVIYAPGGRVTWATGTDRYPVVGRLEIP